MTCTTSHLICALYLNLIQGQRGHIHNLWLNWSTCPLRDLLNSSKTNERCGHEMWGRRIYRLHGLWTLSTGNTEKTCGTSVDVKVFYQTPSWQLHKDIISQQFQTLWHSSPATVFNGKPYFIACGRAKTLTGVKCVNSVLHYLFISCSIFTG